MSDHSPANPWGCHSKPRHEGYWGKVRFVLNGVATPMSDNVWIKDTLSKDCKYRHESPGDPRCEGCTCP